ncbi:hypothetical protein FACS189464_2930 [Bacteroidia bacterium]|nr:hypothetical protein FACS189464_2930 [Bacteroidia bacterium]
MSDFLLYLLKANAVLLILYVFYVLFLKHDTFYGYHRWYLLATALLALLLPLASLSAWFAAPAVAAVQQMPSVEDFYRILLPLQTMDSPSVAVSLPSIRIETLLAGILLAGTGWLLISRLRQLTHVLHLSWHTPEQMYGQQSVKTIDAPIQPFSFFRWIFLPLSRWREDMLEEIVSHEQIHCRNLHSVDILLAELLTCCCWYNPVVWLLRREIRSNIEFYTDRQMLAHGFERKHYQYQLLNVSSGVSRYSIVNYFYFNQLKKRIIMMNKKDSPKILVAKYLLAIPVMFATMLAVRASGIETVITKNAETTVSIHAKAQQPEQPITVNRQNAAPKQKKPVQQTEHGIAFTAQDSIVARTAEPLYILDDKIVLKSQLRFEAESITVLKNDAAIEKYGALGKNGVVLIQTKGLQDEPNFFVRGLSLENQPLIIVDDKIVSKKELEQLSPENIQSFIVLKNDAATEKYGEQGKNGVIIVTLKNEKDRNAALPSNENVSSDYRIRQGTVERINE